MFKTLFFTCQIFQDRAYFITLFDSVLFYNSTYIVCMFAASHNELFINSPRAGGGAEMSGAAAGSADC